MLQIKLKPHNTDHVFMLGSDAYKIAEGMVKYSLDQGAARVEFLLPETLVDKYGNTAEIVVLTLPYSMDDLKKINYSGGALSEWGFLNLAEQLENVHKVGREFVGAFCKDATHAKNSKRFCAREYFSGSSNNTGATAGLGISLESFQKRFNGDIEAFDSKLKISKIKIKEGDTINSFEHIFTKNISMVGTLDKHTGAIVSLMLLGSKNIQSKEATTLYVLLDALSAAVGSEQADEKDAGLEVVNFMQAVSNNIDGKEPIHKNFRGIRLSGLASNKVGVIVTMTKPD